MEVRRQRIPESRSRHREAAVCTIGVELSMNTKCIERALFLKCLQWVEGTKIYVAKGVLLPWS